MASCRSQHVTEGQQEYSPDPFIPSAIADQKVPKENFEAPIAADDVPVVIWGEGYSRTMKRLEWSLPQSAATRLIEWSSRDGSMPLPLERVRELCEARFAARLPRKDVKVRSITLQNADKVSEGKRFLPKDWESRWFYVVHGDVVGRGGTAPEDEVSLTVLILSDGTILEPIERDFYDKSK